MFYEIIEIAVVILLFWAGITQIILPSIRGTIAENKLEKEINNLKEKEGLSTV